MTRLAGNVFDFLAQLHDQLIEGAGGAVVIVAPDLIQQFVPGENLARTRVKELEQFFVNYHELTGKEYRIIDVRGPGEARRRIEEAIKVKRKTA